jgi:oligopeptidase B
MNHPLPIPPRAEKRPRVETWHGHEKRDDYHWLKADNWQEVMHDPAVLPQDIRHFLEGENAYHESVMADTKALQDKLFAELKGRIKEDDSSVPAPDGPFDYYSRYVTGGQHPRLPQAPRSGRAGTAAAGRQCAGKGPRVFSLRRGGHVT